ncbi:hypothetical protein [Streptomyces hundungensis]|uniref:hypothetical protein n=1 Tax=Streptomyces hundungensis TaxID=1077946 RepID=UPI0033F87AB5
MRRFFCERAECRRQTFVEQVPDLKRTVPSPSVGLQQWIRSIATFLGGRPGQRLCQSLHFPSSDSSTISAKWRLCLEKNNVVLEAKCTNKSLLGSWQSTTCSAGASYIVKKGDKVLPGFDGMCAVHEHGVLTAKTCPAGKERGKKLTSQASDGVIDRAAGFECDGAGKYL